MTFQSNMNFYWLLIYVTQNTLIKPRNQNITKPMLLLSKIFHQFRNFSLQSDQFQNIYCQFSKGRIICTLDENMYLILKRTKKDDYIILQKGKMCLKMSVDLHNLICDSKVSVTFLHSFLEPNMSTDNAQLC